MHGLCNLVGDRAWDGVEMTEVLEMLGALGAGFEEVFSGDGHGAGCKGLGVVLAVWFLCEHSVGVIYFSILFRHLA
jgi:hypothetical protein